VGGRKRVEKGRGLKCRGLGRGGRRGGGMGGEAVADGRGDGVEGNEGRLMRGEKEDSEGFGGRIVVESGCGAMGRGGKGGGECI